MTDTLLSVERLGVEFTTRAGTARVIDDLSFTLQAGETLGIVGESGCGKSMTALAIMGLVPVPPGKIANGQIRLQGEDLLQASPQRLSEVRGNEIAMIFQEPMTSLNPVFTVGEQIAEAVRLHQNLGPKEALQRALEMLRAVHIPAPKIRLQEYPHQLSGGMRQRVMIAMALACNPSVLIADEPTTALDVTVQAQIFDLLQEIQQTTGAAIILITHDMGVIAELTQRVIVMYAGRKVEEGPVGAILQQPAHPYTQGLIQCVPHLQMPPALERPPLLEIPGVVPALSELGRGCAFAPRCAQVLDHCPQSAPRIQTIRPEQSAACWLYDKRPSP